jgi:hypothetical protein
LAAPVAQIILSLSISLIAMKGLLLSVLFVGSGAVELTKETWDSAVAGKSVFVKFLAPW